MTNSIKVLNTMVGRLSNILGKLTKGMTEEDFARMEEKNLKVHKDLIEGAQEESQKAA